LLRQQSNVLHVSSGLIFLVIRLLYMYITMLVKYSTAFSNVLAILLFSQQLIFNNTINSSDNHKIGKKLPIFPFMVLNKIGPQMCFRECEVYTFCMSINFNRRMLTCKLNCLRLTENLRLVDDNDYIYREIPWVVSMTDLRFHIFIF
jgi:hypothetical protein